MILSDKVKVKSSQYYHTIGYDISNKYIFVNLIDVPLGSRSMVLAKCDFCENEKELTYKSYNENIKKSGKYACSIKCGSIKSKESNLEKWGVESYFQSDSFKDKSKKTLLDKWGVDHISKSKDISKSKSDKMSEKSEEISKRMKDYYLNLSKLEISEINKKREVTNLERFGFKYPSQVDYIKDKIRLTNLERWGGYTLESDILKKKVKETNLERWGYEFPSQSEEVKKKVKQTNLERFGVESILQHSKIKDKIRLTNLERWGVDNIFKLESVKESIRNKFFHKYGTDSYFKTSEFRNSKLGNILSDEDWRVKNFDISKDKNYISYIGDNVSRFNCNSGHIFDINSSNYHNRIRLGVPTCTICFPISKSSSIMEKELSKFINSIYDGKIIDSYRDGLEIDVYLPDLKLGFEFNGLYYHSSEFKEKNYHLNKTKHFGERGIRIIHIWEDDWKNRRDIVKSQITNLLGLTSNKIFARRCEVREISDSKLARKFLDENHIQGFVNSRKKVGLYYDDELVSIMTFDDNEGRKKMELGGWNLSRFCNKRDYNVIGSASKLLNYFIKKYSPKRVISYADKDWSIGDLYFKLGFISLGDLEVDYKYVVDGNRVHKSRFKKSRFEKMGYDISQKTEFQLIEDVNIIKIYNCGKIKFELKLS